MVSELQGTYMFCLFKAVTPIWCTNTDQFTQAIDYIRCWDPFEVLQAKVNCLFSFGIACPVRRTLSKQYFFVKYHEHRIT